MALVCSGQRQLTHPSRSGAEMGKGRGPLLYPQGSGAALARVQGKAWTSLLLRQEEVKGPASQLPHVRSSAWSERSPRSSERLTRNFFWFDWKKARLIGILSPAQLSPGLRLASAPPWVGPSWQPFQRSDSVPFRGPLAGARLLSPACATSPTR